MRLTKVMRHLSWVGLISACAACSEHKLEVSNATPEATITSPTDGAVIEEGEFIATGSVSDPDERTEALAASWWLNGELICPDATPAEFGNTSCAMELSEGEAEIKLQVRDSDDAVGLDVVNVTTEPGEEPPNTPPECAITAPDSGSILSPGDDVLLTGTATDIDQGAHTLGAIWESDTDGVLGDTAPNTDGTIQVVAAPLSPGLHVVSLTVTDATGEVCTDSISVRAGTAPEITITAPAGGAVLPEGTPVVFTASVSDAEDVPTDLLVQWTTTDGDALGSGTADSVGLASIETLLGMGEHAVTATVTDLHGQIGTDTVSVVVDDVPAAMDVGISPNPAWADDVLLCSWTLIDSGTVDASIASWTINGVAVGTGTALSSGFVHGDTVACTVTPDDGVLVGGPATATLVISNTPPTVDSVLIAPAAPIAADTLTCSYSGFVDLDGEADASTIRWHVDGVDAGEGPTLAGAFTRGDVVSCTVTPSDGVADGAPVMAAVTIGNTPPEVSVVSLMPEAVYTNTIVSSLVTTVDAEGDTVTLSHAWTVDGVPVAETGSSLSGLEYFDKHQVVSLMVTPSDGIESGPAVAAGSRLVRNTPPGPPELIVIPEVPVEGVDDVWCAIDTESSDADEDTPSYTYDWSLDGVPWSGSVSTTTVSGDTVPLSETIAGQEWTCTVTPSDGEEAGEAASISVVIDNAETRVFVTSYATSSDMGGPSGGDDFCTSVAEEGGLGGSWVAYLSGGGASAITRIPDGPFVRLDGAPIADDKIDLTDGSIANPININELGTTTYGFVCTGSSESGYATGPATASGGNCQGWTRGCGVCDGDHWYVEVGRPERTSDDWSTAGWNFCGSCALYCFEQ